MKEKKRMIVPSVTTRDALDFCLKEQAMLFCVENPLYSELCSELHSMAELANYQFEIYADKQVIMFKKVNGENAFDDSKIEIFYPPLQWDGWTS